MSNSQQTCIWRESPKTVEALLKLLPYRSNIIHARFSGEAIRVPLPADFPMDVPLENQTSYPSRGDSLYYPGFVSEKEVLIPYGATIFSSRVGQSAWKPFCDSLTASFTN